MKDRREILIATIPGDLHALSVAEALRLKGAQPIIWYTSDYPMQVAETVEFGTTGSKPQLSGLPLSESYFSIWNRRAIHELDLKQLHPADRSFAALQCRRFRVALLTEVLSGKWTESGLCVNPYARIPLAENKLAQTFAAQRVGLTTPESLFSNDSEKIRRFIAAHAGAVVYKPLKAMAWIREDEELLNFTEKISEKDLVSDEMMRMAPGIFQEIVPKKYEIRATLLGRRAFAAKVNSQDTAHGTLDWRRAYDELTMERAELPKPLHERCIHLMKELGIYSGCFDFVVTPDDRWVFLEVNQGGQFLFVEEYTGFPLVDAFAEFLRQGRSDFSWEESDTTIRMEDVVATAVDKAKASLEEHVVSRPPSVVEKERLDEPQKTLI